MYTPNLPNNDHVSDDTATRKRKPFHRQTRFWVGVLIVLIVIILLQHLPSLFGNRHKTPGVPVVLSVASTSDVPVYLTELGAVTAVYTVTVKTQVNGLLLQVFYQEGQIVKTGELLAQIDPRPYEALLVQYEGQLERDKALLANAQIDLKRYQTLWKQDSVAQQTLATQQSLVQQDEGAVKTDEGLIQSTKLNIYYCRIISPIDGRVGLRLVDPGNYVQISDTTGLMVINTVTPIEVVFSIPEDNVPDVLNAINTNKSLLVNAYDRQQNLLLAAGTLMTMDNQIDPTTGTVKLKAVFPNKDLRLFPNQFVNAQLLVKTLQNATIVPTAAVQHGANNDFVYLLNSDQTVSVKPIVAGAVYGDNTVVTSGLTPGQSVVVEGADKLIDGSTVTVATSKSSTDIKTTSRSKWRFFA